MSEPVTHCIEGSDAGSIGGRMHRLARELYPICRSITGDGVRQTLAILKREIPMEIHEVPSGTPVLDWTVPKEWNIRDAYIKNRAGERIVDFKKSNLHVVSYSIPVNRRMPLADLRKNLYSLPEHPDWIPYRTSYYNETWGFSLSHRLLQSLPDAEYDVYIDSTLQNGHLTYGELLLPGAQPDEVLISCHICHPSLCNDNLSGMTVATELARWVAARSARRYSYRFLFIPGTIGSITWLAHNEANVHRIRHGLVVTCVGDGGRFTYKKSRRGDAEIDHAVEQVLKHSGQPYVVEDFFPYGYDERQYCSPGYNLPVGCLMRSPHGTFPEYHTSADNLEFVRAPFLEGTLCRYIETMEVLEGNATYRNLNPKGEPQLGRRGLYSAFGTKPNHKLNQMAVLWVLNFSDGQHSLLDIAMRSGISFGDVRLAADALVECALLAEC